MTGAAIAADAVNGGHVLDESLSGADILDGSIGAGDLGAGSVGSGAIATGAVGSSELAAGSVGAAAIAPGAVNSAHITANAVTGSHVVNGSLTGADMSAILSLTDVSVSGDLYNSSGTLVLNDTVQVTGPLTAGTVVTGPLTAGTVNTGSLGVTNLTVSGSASINGVLYDPSGDLTISDNLNISGGLYDSGGDLYINDTLDVSGAIDAQSYIYDSTGTLTLNDSVQVTGQLNASGGMVGGTVQNNVSNSSVSTGTLTVSGNASINGAISDPSGDLTINDGLNVLGTLYDSGSDLYIGDYLDVSGAIDAQSYIYDSNSNLYLQDYVDIEYDLDVRDQLDVGDGSTVPWQVRATSANGPTNAYLGVQGTDNFDANTLVDIVGLEIGVLGVSTGTTTTDNAGVYGYSNSVGVQGVGSWAGGDFADAEGTSRTLIANGNYGVQANGNSYGVFAIGTTAGLYAYDANTPTSYGYVGYGGYGLYGSSNTSGAYSIYGRNGLSSANSGTRAINGWVSSSSAYGVYSAGKFAASGSKSFINPHPTDPTKEVHMVCLEGNESGTYFRGTDWIENGQAVIVVPEVFRLASIEERLTVQVTAVGAPAQLWIESKNLDMIVVRSDADVEFDYFVNGVRRGYSELTDEDLIQDNFAYWPMEADKPFATQYPDEYRQILVENGLLNPDFTPNVQTMALLEVAVEDYARAKSEHEEMAQERLEMEAREANRATGAVDEDPVDSLTGTHPMESQESNR